MSATLRHLTALLFALLLAPPSQAESTRPTLIVAIAVDQFSGDLFAEYRAHFHGGFKRLAGGAVFPRGYQSHAATETCPGHATLLTGARPARSGIIANHWLDQSIARADKRVYCVEDETQPGADSQNYMVATKHLRVPTLGTRMKARDAASRVVAVAGKDRAAVLMGGADADQTWWWGGQGFVSFPGVQASSAVTDVNSAVTRRMNAARTAMALPAWCEARAYPVTLADGRAIGTGRFAREAHDAKAFRASPELDEATLELAGGLLDELALGQGPHTDLLAIGVSATDLVGHAYGTAGSEMCVQLDALDRALQALFSQLDRRGIDYLVMLSADHGGHDAPERSDANAIPDAARVDAALLPTELNDRVARATGLSGQVLLGDAPAGDMYLARRLDPTQRAAVSKAALTLWRQHPQVAAVYTREEISRQPSPPGPPDAWSLLDEVRASFDAERSGDFVVLLKPRITPIAQAAPGYIATHGSPWDYDRRVPMLFWRKDMAGFEQANSVETVDILPTLAALIGLPIEAGEVDGHCLDLDPGEGDSCAGD